MSQMAKQGTHTSDMSELPCELQWQILDYLDQKDHVSMHRTSSSWRNMLIRYLNNKDAIKFSDWRWFCRHFPQRPSCSECMAKLLSKIDDRQLAKDWNWWLQDL